MSISQRRSGPINVGNYGLTAPFINAFSLIISTIQFPKSAVIILFILFPLLFILFSFIITSIIHPSFNVDIGLSFIIFIIIYSIALLFIILSSLSSSSKYSIIGSIRIISIILAFELILSSLIIIIISIYDSFELYLLFYSILFIINIDFSIWSIISFPFIISIIIIYIYLLQLRFRLISYRSFISFIIIIIVVIICILVESNRQPFDQSEAESEIIAGFLTDFSSTLFILLLLTEYANIIFISYLFIILFIIYPIFIITSIFIISLSRSLFSRFRYDLLIYYFWSNILSFIFSWFIAILNVYSESAGIFMELQLLLALFISILLLYLLLSNLFYYYLQCPIPFRRYFFIVNIMIIFDWYFIRWSQQDRNYSIKHLVKS